MESSRLQIPLLTAGLSAGLSRQLHLKKNIVVAATFGLYGSWWYFLASKKTRLCLGTCHPSLIRVLAQCPTLQSTYYPTFLAPTALLQLVVAGFRELAYGWLPLTPSPYRRRDLLQLEDGQSVALDWLLPSSGARTQETRRHLHQGAGGKEEEKEDAPPCVAVLCHGAFQSSHSAPMINIAQAIVRDLKFPVVVFNRRGYEVALSVPRTDFYGSDEDMDQVLRHVNTLYPGHRVCLVGFSCGGMFVARYLSQRTSHYAHGSPPSPPSPPQRQQQRPTGVGGLSGGAARLAATTQETSDAASSGQISLLLPEPQEMRAPLPPVAQRATGGARSCASTTTDGVGSALKIVAPPTHRGDNNHSDPFPPPPFPPASISILGGVVLDYGWHGGDDGAVSRIPSFVREGIACLIWVQYLWRHANVLQASSSSTTSTDATASEGGGGGGRAGFWSSLWRGQVCVYAFQRAREASSSSSSRNGVFHRSRTISGSVQSGESKASHNAFRGHNRGDVCRLSEVGAPLLLVNSRDDPVLVWGNREPHLLAESDSNPFVVRWELARGGHGTKSTGLAGLRPSKDLAPRAICEFLAALRFELRARIADENARACGSGESWHKFNSKTLPP